MTIPENVKSGAWILVALATSISLSIWLLGPSTVVDCTNTIFGDGGDSTAGYIWLEWNYEVLSGTPLRDTTPLLSHPEGAPLWQPFYVTSLLLMLPTFVATHLVGPVCSWNIAVHAGLVLNGLTMFLFAKWLTRRNAVALFAAVAFELLPFHLQKAYGHLAYVHTWVFVLIAWSFLLLWRRQNRRASIVAGASVALAAYTDGYYLLLGGVFAGALGLGLLLLPQATPIRRRLLNLAIAGGTATVLLLPVGLTLLTSRQEIGAVVDRSATEAKVYSARPWEYVLPARHHPIYSETFGAWQDRHLHESNYSEQTLYLGAPVLVGAIAAVATGLLRIRRKADDEREALASAAVALGLIALVVTGLFSAPPRVPVGPLTLPFPSGIVVEALPFWRVFARFFIPLSVAVVMLAAIGVDRMTRVRGRRLDVVVLLLIGVVVFDFLPPGERLTFSYDTETPRVYDWLDDRPAHEVVAEYPLDPPPLPNHIRYLSYQRAHQHPLVNGAPAETDAGQLRAALGGLADPQTVPTLRALGTRWVVVHEEAFGHPVDGDELPPTLVPRFRSPSGDVYEVVGEPAPAALVAGEGFFPRDTEGFRSFRWMGTRGTLEVRSFARGLRRLQVGFDAVSFGRPRRLTIRQGGDVRWSGTVPGDRRLPITFSADPRRPLELEASPPAVAIETLLPETNDAREVSINLGGFSVADASAEAPTG